MPPTVLSQGTNPGLTPDLHLAQNLHDQAMSAPEHPSGPPGGPTVGPPVGPPTISVLFLAFNQARFVEHAARSVLEQRDVAPLEILLSDDASTDATFDVLSLLADQYRGPHHVRVRRNARNLGIGAHYNALIAESKGELLITAAGDDLSVPNRAQRILAAWDASGRRADLIASDLQDLNAHGQAGETIRVDDLAHWRNASDWGERRPYVVGAAQAFTRRLFNQFGPFRPNVVYEDQINTLRAILMGGAITIAEPLVKYRRGGVSAGLPSSDATLFLSRTRARHQREVAEIDQMLQDATSVGEAASVRHALEITINRAALLGQLLGPPEQQTLSAVFDAARKLPLFWCLRQYVYLRWPSIGAAAQRNKAKRSATRQALRDRIRT